MSETTDQARLERWTVNVNSGVRQFLNVYAELQAMVDEYNRMGYGTLLGSLVEPVNGNTDPTDLINFVTTMGNIESTINAGNGTNLEKVKQV